jgi:hypothetical protein
LSEVRGRSKQAASFLKNRSKKLLSVAPSGNVMISRRDPAKPIGSCERATVGVARNGDGLRRRECGGNDEWGKFFGSLFFKKGTACFLLATSPPDEASTAAVGGRAS